MTITHSQSALEPYAVNAGASDEPSARHFFLQTLRSDRRRSGTTTDSVGLLLELVALLHADGWDFQIVLWFERPVRWCCACWERFGLKFGYLVVADEDTWGVLLASQRMYLVKKRYDILLW